MKKTKNRRKQFIGENPIEAKRDDSIIDSAISTAKDFADDFWEQTLGIKSEKSLKSAGDLQEGQELNLKELQQKKATRSLENAEKAYVEPAINYSREIVQTAERSIARQGREIETQLKEIMAEIKKLTDSSKTLQLQFKEVAVEQHNIKPGKYHKSFFQWLLIMVRNARMKVEDSSSWLAAMQSKRKSREYGAMAKKHGTTFSLSNERVVATQVG
ncbi:MAG: hypothetical protein HY424_03225 [Candidatus Levybacteria bacterium]|nr:hypothetical protein [Candidatus Levybacteria bacterium]